VGIEHDQQDCVQQIVLFLLNSRDANELVGTSPGHGQVFTTIEKEKEKEKESESERETDTGKAREHTRTHTDTHTHIDR
jgi:hypothetical protein